MTNQTLFPSCLQLVAKSGPKFKIRWKRKEVRKLMQVAGSTVEMKKRVQGKKEVGEVEEERRREGQRRKKELWPKDSRLSHSCCI